MRVNNTVKRQQAARRLRSINSLYNTLDAKIHDLEEFVNYKELSEDQVEKWNRRYGARESEASMLIKLIGAMKQIIPMENDVMESLENIKDKKIQEVSKEDVEIIKRYLEKVRHEVKPVEEEGDMDTKGEGG